MSALPVIEYLAGFFGVGFIDLIMNDVVMASREAYWSVVNGTAIQSSLSFTDQLSIWFWHGILIVYILFGAWWLLRKYTEPTAR